MMPEGVGLAILRPNPLTPYSARIIVWPCPLTRWPIFLRLRSFCGWTRPGRRPSSGADGCSFASHQARDMAALPRGWRTFSPTTSTETTLVSCAGSDRSRVEARTYRDDGGLTMVSSDGLLDASPVLPGFTCALAEVLR